MKPTLLIASFICLFSALYADAVETPEKEALTYTVSRHYKHRPDGKPGREILLTYNGQEEIKGSQITIEAGQVTEKTTVQSNKGEAISLLLPPDVGVSEEAQVKVSLGTGEKAITQTLTVPALRQWTVYIYPHSHVDIGYTNTQKNVEIIHKRNLEYAMELAEKTRDYPKDSRFLWNPEVTWPIERYMHSETPEKKAKLLESIKRGDISVDAGYVSTNTSACNDEELFELFRYSKELQKLTGKEIKTLVQVDIPGMSWGVVPVAAQMGIRYCMVPFNGSDRVGLSYELSFKPFWWIAPDGKSKILFLQPGSYAPGAQIKGKHFWPLMAGQTDPDKLLRIVKTDKPRENFIDSYLNETLPNLEKSDYYPYDIFPMTWCMADNTPVDFDLPEAVKSWNEDYAFPHLVISSATQMMQAFEDKYGDEIPTRRGDFTEYWTDGLGSSAKHTGTARLVKERLIQTEILQSMFAPNKLSPREKFADAWQNVILGTEHTWAYMRPDQQPICDDILKVKFGYFEKAEALSKELLEETLSTPSDSSATVAVFNTHSWAHGGMVTVPGKQSETFLSVMDSDGKEVPSQRLSTGELAFMTENIPALGYKKYTLSPQKSTLPDQPFIKGNSLDNGIVQLTLDPQSGDINSIKAKGIEFADAKDTCAVNSYRYLRGEDSSDKAIKDKNISVSIKEKGPLLCSFLITSEAEGCESLTREISLTAGQPHIELRNTLDKLPVTEKEGIHFGFSFDIPQPQTRADIPWGIMEVEKDQLKEGNRNWITFQRWLDISNDSKGITWCSLNASSFEQGDITANILGGAYQSPKWIRELKPSSTIYSWALNNHWHTNFPLSQKGTLVFQYRILPHDSAFNAVSANRFGMEQAQPLIVSFVDKDFELPSLFALSGDPSVTISVLKTVEEGKSMIVRLRSLSPTDQKVTLEWKSKQPQSIQICDFHEEGGSQTVENNQVTVPHMGFITLKVNW